MSSDFSFDDLDKLDIEASRSGGRGEKSPIRVLLDKFIESDQVITRWTLADLPVITDIHGQALNSVVSYKKTKVLLGALAKKRHDEGLEDQYAYYVLKDSIILLNLENASNEEKRKFLVKNTRAVKPSWIADSLTADAS